MIKRKILIGLLAFGAVGGFATGFASMARHHRCHRDHFERRVARVCVDAARRAETEAASIAAAPPPGGHHE